MKRSDALRFRQTIEAAAALQDDGAALDNIFLYPSWQPGLSVGVGERYRYGEKLYKVVQAHTTQADWVPSDTPALFAEVSVEEWPEWVQPTGAQDAYNAGDKVSHNNKHWTSIINANVWEPGGVGTESLWSEVE